MRPLVSVLRFGRPVTGRLALAVLCGIAASAMAIGLTSTSAWLISRAAQQPPVLYLLVAVTSVRAFGIGRGVFRYAERLAAHDAAFRVLAELRGRLYERLERLAPAGLADYRSGDLLARLVADIDGLADLWLRVLLPYAGAAVVSVGTVLLVGWLVPIAGVILAVSLLFVALAVPLATGSLTARSERRASPARGALSAAVFEALAGGPELLAAGATGTAMAGLEAADADLAAVEAASAAGGGLGTLLASLASGASVWLALVAGILAVESGRLDGVALAVVALTPIAAHEVVAGLVQAAQHVPGLAVAARRVVEILERPDPVREPAAPSPLPAGPYGLRVRGLAAGYGTAPAVLRGIDLSVDSGRRALVLGASGSGKTTLAAVLLRFLQPGEGTVELVGAGQAVDMTELDSDGVRSIVGLCTQEPHVFDTSIRENLLLARPGSDDGELRRALATARLLDWIDELPAGLDTLVGEHGARLSGGQRQRLSLARAFLADRPVLILDEPTEHLDESMAAELMADVLAATADRTLVVLTHRPELMGDVDWQTIVDLGDPAASEAA